MANMIEQSLLCKVLDGDKWDKFKWLIVTGLVTLILGYLAVSVGLK